MPGTAPTVIDLYPSALYEVKKEVLLCFTQGSKEHKRGTNDNSKILQVLCVTHIRG